MGNNERYDIIWDDYDYLENEDRIFTIESKRGKIGIDHSSAQYELTCGYVVVHRLSAGKEHRLPDGTLDEFVKRSAFTFKRVYYNGRDVVKMYGDTDPYTVDSMGCILNNYWLDSGEDNNDLIERCDSIKFEFDKFKKIGVDVKVIPDSGTQKSLEMICSGLSLGNVLNSTGLIKLYRQISQFFNPDCTALIADYVVLISAVAF